MAASAPTWPLAAHTTHPLTSGLRRSASPSSKPSPLSFFTPLAAPCSQNTTCTSSPSSSKSKASPFTGPNTGDTTFLFSSRSTNSRPSGNSSPCHLLWLSTVAPPSCRRSTTTSQPSSRPGLKHRNLSSPPVALALVSSHPLTPSILFPLLPTIFFCDPFPLAGFLTSIVASKLGL